MAITLLISLAAALGTMPGKGGVPLSYRTEPAVIATAAAPAETPAIMILTGYSESYVYYADLIADFNSHGFDVFIVDHRGMGRSGRMLENRQIVHVDVFSDYVDDAEKFLTDVVLPQRRGKLYLFAHSMGGLVGASLLARRSSDFAAAVLSAPLMSLDTGWIPKWLAATLVSSARALGYGSSYALGFSDFDPVAYTFDQNRTTRSRERFETQRKLMIDNPDVVMGGPSYDWLHAVTSHLETLADIAKKISTKTMLLQAGDDSFVGVDGQNSFCETVSDCRKFVFSNSRHELFRETDDVREPMLREVFSAFGGR